jgi:pentatricopeptide repeat protein
MDGLLKCGELDAALELVEFMRHAGLAPSAVGTPKKRKCMLGSRRRAWFFYL